MHLRTQFTKVNCLWGRQKSTPKKILSFSKASVYLRYLFLRHPTIPHSYKGSGPTWMRTCMEKHCPVTSIVSVLLHIFKTTFNDPFHQVNVSLPSPRTTLNTGPSAAWSIRSLLSDIQKDQQAQNSIPRETWACSCTSWVSVTMVALVLTVFMLPALSFGPETMLGATSHRFQGGFHSFAPTRAMHLLWH